MFNLDRIMNFDINSSVFALENGSMITNCKNVKKSQGRVILISLYQTKTIFWRLL